MVYKKLGTRINSCPALFSEGKSNEQRIHEILLEAMYWKERDSAQPRLLEAILYKDNFNRAYKRVKANKGKHGVDGMTVEEAFLYLREHQKELITPSYSISSCVLLMSNREYSTSYIIVRIFV